jgi:hypothetical protein
MRGRRRIALIAAAVTVVLAAGLAAIALAAGGSSQREAAQLLRLGDLPLGYITNELEEDRGKVAECRPLTEPDDTPSQMLKFIQRYHPRGCIFGFTFSYGEPEARRNPLLVGTGVLDARSASEANAGWKAVPEMLGRLLGANPPQRAEAPAKVGSATRLFHARTVIIGIGAKAPISFLVWRSGNTLAAVMTAGRSVEIDDAAALLLARRQQARIAKPTPLTVADNYDAEVALENPALDLPVYWLGRHFATGGAVADASLYSSWFVAKPTPELQEESGSFEGPLPKLRLTYSNPVNLTLSTWGPQDWPVYSRSKTAKALVTWKCTQTRTVEVPGGTATIYLGYDQDYAKCPSRKPRSVTAWVKFGEDTVVVNEPFAADSLEPDGPWGSFAAMEAVVKALRPRISPAR